MRFARRLLSLLPRPLRDRLIRSQVRVDEAEIAGLRVEIASSVRDHEAAARLVHDNYVARGLLQPLHGGVRVTPHTLSASSVVFVAKRGDRVVGTISLIQDSELGLPMEHIYGDEIGALRGQGRKLAEVGALCIDPEHRGAGVVYLLNRLMSDVANELLGIDDLLIAVHPNAEDLYRAALLFERIGAVNRYPGLEESAMAVALRLDFTSHRERYRSAFGARPRDCANPFWLYFERQNPQTQPLPICAQIIRDELMRRRASIRLSVLAFGPRHARPGVPSVAAV